MVGRLGAARLPDVALLQGGLAYLTDVLEAARTMQGEMRRGMARPSGGAGTDTERHDGRKRGVVTRVIRYGGYAFVKPQCSDEQPDVFMHLSSLQGGFAWDDLEEGMTVLYRDRTDRQGRRVATAVWPLKADMPVVTH